MMLSRCPMALWAISWPTTSASSSADRTKCSRPVVTTIFRPSAYAFTVSWSLNHTGYGQLRMPAIANARFAPSCSIMTSSGAARAPAFSRSSIAARALLPSMLSPLSATTRAPALTPAAAAGKCGCTYSTRTSPGAAGKTASPLNIVRCRSGSLRIRP